MYRLLEWAFAYDDGSGLPDAGAYAAELKNVTATADGKPVQGFDPTKTGTWTIPAGTQVNIVDMPDDWKLDGKADAVNASKTDKTVADDRLCILSAKDHY